MMDYAQARKNMVDCQLKPNSVTDKRILQAFADIPREAFVENATRNIAYTDDYVSCGDDRALLPPTTLARMIQSLDIQSSDHILVVAAGAGYASAILSRLGNVVYALEDNEELRDMARHVFSESETKNIIWVKGPLEKGWLPSAPYDKILIDVPAEIVPAGLFEQLKPQGRLAAIVQGEDGLMEATVFTKTGKTRFCEALFETYGTPFASFKAEESFVF